MTAIAALKSGSTIWMGGDSAGVGYYDLEIRRDPKVFLRDNFLFGFCGSFRAGQIIHYEWEPPEHKPALSTEEFIYTEFLGSIRKVLKANGVCQISDSVESTDAAVAIGYRKRLFIMYGDFQISIPAESYVGLGCGGDLVRGSLYTTCKLKLDLEPSEQIKLALQAAQAGSAGVRGPFRILKLES